VNNPQCNWGTSGIKIFINPIGVSQEQGIANFILKLLGNSCGVYLHAGLSFPPVKTGGYSQETPAEFYLLNHIDI